LYTKSELSGQEITVTEIRVSIANLAINMQCIHSESDNALYGLTPIAIPMRCISRRFWQLFQL